MTLANHPNVVNLSIMRGVRFALPFKLRNKVTGVVVNLTGKTLKLRVYKMVGSVETEVVTVTGTSAVPVSGEGAFDMTTAETAALTLGTEHWYKATVENGAEVELLLGYGYLVVKDAKP